MAQGGQGVGKLSISCGFRMALGKIQDAKGRAQLVADDLQVPPNVCRVGRRAAGSALHAARFLRHEDSERPAPARMCQRRQPVSIRLRCAAGAAWIPKANSIRGGFGEQVLDAPLPPYGSSLPERSYSRRGFLVRVGVFAVLEDNIASRFTLSPNRSAAQDAPRNPRD